MKTDAEIRHEGVRALMHALVTVEAERFIALINREQFDHTEWRRAQWQDESVATLAEKARLKRAADKA